MNVRLRNRRKDRTGEKLPRQVKALGLVSFFNDAASEMIVPLMPIFVTSTLGLGPHILGIMEGAAESVAAILKYLSGWWSDRLKRRKPLAVAGYFLSSLLRPLMGAATAAWHVVSIRSADRIGKGVRTSPRDALLASWAAPGARGKAFGFHRAMDHAGAVVGPLIAMALLSWGSLDLRTLFFLSAVPGAIAVALMLFAVKERSIDRGVDNCEPAERQSDPEKIDGSDRRSFSLFLVAMVVFTLGNSTDIFLVLHAHQLGVPLAFAPLLWVVLHMAKTAFATPGGALSDRIGRKNAILIGWGVYALAYFGLAMATDAWQVWPLLAFYGLFYGLTEGPERALTADLVPSNRRGGGFGLYHLSIGFASFPASVVAGYLWEIYGAGVALGVGAVCAVLASLILAFGVPNRPRH